MHIEDIQKERCTLGKLGSKVIYKEVFSKDVFKTKLSMVIS